MKLIGIDPGLAHLGFAVAELRETQVVFVDAGVIVTEKSDKKRNVKASDDNVQRGRLMYAELRKVFDSHLPVALCAEAMSFPRNASAAAKMAITWGILISIAEQRGIPVLQSSPKEVKNAVTGSGTASKEDVAKSLDLQYDGQLARLLERTKAGIREHAYDAGASLVSCLNSDVVRMARRLGH